MILRQISDDKGIEFYIKKPQMQRLKLLKTCEAYDILVDTKFDLKIYICGKGAWKIVEKKGKYKRGFTYRKLNGNIDGRFFPRFTRHKSLYTTVEPVERILETYVAKQEKKLIRDKLKLEQSKKNVKDKR